MSIQLGSSKSTFDIEGHIERLEADGFSIIEDFLDPTQLVDVRIGLEPHLDHYRGRNPFEGLATERVYTLVARGCVFEDISEDARVLALLDRFLRPGYLLTASQAICIHPGEVGQALHYDDSFYPIPRPRPAISLSIVIAVDAFTAENGGTVIVPGSHRWGDAEVTTVRTAVVNGEAFPLPNERFSVEMPAGAAVIFLGTLVHGGGANRSQSARLAITNQYCEPWARTQENYFIGVPREIARGFSPRLRELLGYSVMPPFMGQVTGSHPAKTLEDGYITPVERSRSARED